MAFVFDHLRDDHRHRTRAPPASWLSPHAKLFMHIIIRSGCFNGKPHLQDRHYDKQLKARCINWGEDRLGALLN